MTKRRAKRGSFSLAGSGGKGEWFVNALFEFFLAQGVFDIPVTEGRLDEIDIGVH